MRMPPHLVECLDCGELAEYRHERCPKCGAALRMVQHTKEFWNNVADRARGDVPDDVTPVKEQP